MRNLNRRHTSPVPYRNTNRVQSIRGITSMPAGKMVPLAAIPLNREDSVRSGRVTVMAEMMETYEILLNTVNIRFMAYLVPTLALERFQGSMDILNKSFKNKPPMTGEAVVPYIETHTFRSGDQNDVDREFYKYLGMHAAGDALKNTAYLESYNAIWNHRAANRSPNLQKRDRLEDTLAPAFWVHQHFGHIVPDVDLGMIDGEVALNVVDSRLPVSGVGFYGSAGSVAPDLTVRNSKGDQEIFPSGYAIEGIGNAPVSATEAFLAVRAKEGANTYPDIFAEMAENGITVSLSNIELAKKTQAMAKLRQKYEGLDEDWVLDMLMSGLSIPDQALKQPILLADKRVPFKQVKRYASDSGNLADSITNGMARADLSIRLPRLATGGVIMIVAEAVPDQLFERQGDPYFDAQNAFDDGGYVRDLPDALRDYLDPEKVEVVKNSVIDSAHSAPSDTFGYAELNWRWNLGRPNVGGRYYQPEVDAGLVAARRRLWSADVADPVLGENFYLVGDLPMDVFVVDDQDPFEAVTVGEIVINGLTQFGPRLTEASDSYDKVFEKAPQERIVKDSEE